jgi:adenine-specific DNA methylase
MPTEVRRCNCHNQYQDELYGDGNRLFNIGIKQLRCTVCGRTITKDTTTKSVAKGGKKK